VVIFGLEVCDKVNQYQGWASLELDSCVELWLHNLVQQLCLAWLNFIVLQEQISSLKLAFL